MLAVSQVYLELLFRAGVEAEVRLIRKVIRVEYHTDETCLGNKCLRLLRLTAINPRIFPIAHFCFRVSIYDLRIPSFTLVKSYLPLAYNI